MDNSFCLKANEIDPAGQVATFDLCLVAAGGYLAFLQHCNLAPEHIEKRQPDVSRFRNLERYNGARIERVGVRRR